MWYFKYLNKQHDYENYNCFTLVVDVFKQERNIDLLTAQRLGFSENFRLENKFSLRKIGLQLVDKESQFWKQVTITELQPFDILVFRKNLLHFGIYIGNNKILHLPEESKTLVSEFDDSLRECVYGCYRYLQ
jgi:cell wall-associated NlpC family hydrolase